MHLRAATEVLIDTFQSVFALLEPAFHFLSDQCLDFLLQCGNFSGFGTHIGLRRTKVGADCVQCLSNTF